MPLIADSRQNLASIRHKRASVSSILKLVSHSSRPVTMIALSMSIVIMLQGELEGMDTQTPLLYMAFPGGRFRLEGTFAYPKSRYTVLKLGSRQSVQLEHAFEHIVRL